jgi:beta-glucosidase
MMPSAQTLPSGDSHLPFPQDFLWGTATAAHQVEGGNTNNNWYAFEQEPGRIFGGHRSGEACGWWEGMAEEDIERMVALNTNAHRLSIEWSRIVPEPGSWNADAIGRYREILSAMREAGITPMVTLHHFSNPLWMEETGGWLNQEAVGWFARYVTDAVGELGDLCDTWCTINEPNVYSAQGYFNGKFPPGHTSMGEYFQVLHNLLAAHARAYHTIHQLQPQARVGLAKHMIAWYPRHPNNPVGNKVTGLLDDMFNGITLGALQTGAWRPLFGKKGVIDHLAGTLDWMGLNYYQRYDAGFSLRALGSLGIDYSAREGKPKGPEGWGELYPDGLYESLDRFNRLFRVPIYITENGVPDETDEVRPGFLLRHLHRSWAAIQQGCPLKGYFFWSLVDNFEWAEGFDPRFRFGLYGVDFATQERTLRRSGELYAEIAQAGGISGDAVRRYAPEVAGELFGDTPSV